MPVMVSASAGVGYRISEMPSAERSTVVGISLPTGGRLLASATPNVQSGECSAATNLRMQVAPLAATLSCQLAILRLLAPLIKIIVALPNPSVEALQEFGKLAAELEPCITAATTASVLPFARDLICLEIRSLDCLQQNLHTMAGLAATQPSSVADSDVRAVIDSYEPIVGVLELAGGLLQMAGVSPLKAPPLAQGTDLDSLAEDQKVIAEYVAALQTVADALGGCGE
jgi:hypothetical protein